MNGIVFQVDTSRVLSIIANEIYDTPLAMLRENLQNAYDAVRERYAEQGTLNEGGQIHITIAERDITITDNGIGMTEDVLRNNFWKAGSSGKHTDRAKRAGVVGTFGIGAMANFGVCSKLVVKTRASGGTQILQSAAELETLRIGEECITFDRIAGDQDVGTTITATLGVKNSITENQALKYLKQYVHMLPVPVYLNNKLISGEKIEDFCRKQGRTFSTLVKKQLSSTSVSASFLIQADANAQVFVLVSDISIGGTNIDGSMALLQNGGQLMGLRSFFGLAPIPAIGQYQFGGHANLAFLHPTAGREALSRTSIEQVTHLINLAEKAASEAIAKSEFADRSNALLSWLLANNRFDLADNITIVEHPGQNNVALGKLKDKLSEKPYLYYLGKDSQVVTTFASESSKVLQISPNNPRRRVQQNYVTNILKIPQVPSSAQILKVYVGSDLDFAEGAILFKIASTLRDDYLISDVDVQFTDISHSVNVLAEKIGEKLKISIARNGPEILPLLGFYDSAYTLFSQFMKDYVRVNIYPSIRNYVPTSTKGGVDALKKLLIKSRELYRYEETDRGDVEGILGDYLSGEESFAKVLNLARTKSRPQTQRVSVHQVGQIETEMPGIVDSPAILAPPLPDGQGYDPSPPIVRDDIASNMKILTATKQYPLLNNFTVFLGVSDKLMKSEAVFFNRPHTTRIIWGGHRVVYIFTEETGTLSLYYDIELKSQMEQSKAGGSAFSTTTLITKSRIFIPIPDILAEEFQVISEPREFYVRFDVLSTDLA